jgi:hypothetical protein
MLISLPTNILYYAQCVRKLYGYRCGLVVRSRDHGFLYHSSDIDIFRPLRIYVFRISDCIIVCSTRGQEQ